MSNSHLSPEDQPQERRERHYGSPEKALPKAPNDTDHTQGEQS